jgi:hypothetical protein
VTYKFAVDIELLEVDSKLIEGASIEVHCGDEVVARFTDGCDSHELIDTLVERVRQKQKGMMNYLCCMATCRSYGSNTAF